VTRPQCYPDQCTPMSLWIRNECKPSCDGLCVTNFDFGMMLRDQLDVPKKLMLLEAKTRYGSLHFGQSKLFELLDYMLTVAAVTDNYYYAKLDYWGFYVLKTKGESPYDGLPMTLNDKPITVQELKDHIGFDKKFCDRYSFSRGFNNGDIVR